MEVWNKWDPIIIQKDKIRNHNFASLLQLCRNIEVAINLRNYLYLISSFEQVNEFCAIQPFLHCNYLSTDAHFP